MNSKLQLISLNTQSDTAYDYDHYLFKAGDKDIRAIQIVDRKKNPPELMGINTFKGKSIYSLDTEQDQLAFLSQYDFKRLDSKELQLEIKQQLLKKNNPQYYNAILDIFKYIVNLSEQKKEILAMPIKSKTREVFGGMLDEL